jgi:hypothetical protein
VTAAPVGAAGTDTVAETPPTELTRGQKAALTREQNKAEALARVKAAAALEAAAPVAINPPAEAPPTPTLAPAAGTTCPVGKDLLSLINALSSVLPVGVSVTVPGAAK